MIFQKIGTTKVILAFLSQKAGPWNHPYLKHALIRIQLIRWHHVPLQAAVTTAYEIWWGVVVSRWYTLLPVFQNAMRIFLCAHGFWARMEYCAALGPGAGSNLWTCAVQWPRWNPEAETNAAHLPQYLIAFRTTQFHTTPLFIFIED